MNDPVACPTCHCHELHIPQSITNRTFFYSKAHAFAVLLLCSNVSFAKNISPRLSRSAGMERPLSGEHCVNCSNAQEPEKCTCGSPLNHVRGCPAGM